MDHKTQKMPSRLLCLCLVAVMLLAMVPVITPTAEAVSAGQKLYLEPGWFASDGAAIWAYFFGSGNPTWVRMTKNTSNGYFEATVPSGGYTTVIFNRADPNISNGSFDTDWNQTGNISLPTDGKNLYKLESNSWSTYSGGSTTPTTPPVTTNAYYLIGYINGSNYNGTDKYPFVNGSLTVTFTSVSYVYVRNNSGKEYMTAGYPGDSATSAKLYDNSTITNDNKLRVPANVAVTFTLTENSDGTLTLSYTTSGSDTPTTPTTPTVPTTPSVVDIPQGNFPAANENTIYLGTTFYDYYTDHEVNGNNRDTYGNFSMGHDCWVPFRKFDTALSDYYSTSNARVPIYTGHFQPEWNDDKNKPWGWPFAKAGLSLYGFKDGQAYGTTSQDQKYFMSVNNGNMNTYPSLNWLDAAAQGIVHSQLVNDTLMIPNKSNGTIVSPYFDAAFLNGNNSQNKKIGHVYNNVKFPFKKTTNAEGIEVWQFDSEKTVLQMQQESGGAYFLQELTSGKGGFFNMNSSGKKQSKYGFFPFNDTAKCDGNAARYNYGYGTRIDVKFNLTKDGKIDGQDIIFRFSGDDDVWVFIDGQLALDIGGSHGKVTGTLNFASMTSKVSRVKDSGGARGNNIEGDDKVRPFSITGKNTDEHTLTMFYMERGMWESNMMLEFNFFPVPETSMTVKKNWEVNDASDIGEITVQLQSKDGANSWANVGEPVVLSGANTIQDRATGEWLYSFTGLDVDLQYRVVELREDGSIIPNGSLTDNDLIVTYGTVNGNADVGYSQTITNKSMPLGHLRVTKAVANGSTGAWTDDEFEIHVDIGGAAYDGQYTVEGTNGRTAEAANGIIKLKGGETAVIDVKPDSSYYVTEVSGRSPDYMASYTASVTSGTAPTCTTTGVSGTLASDASASVTITNNEVGNQAVVVDFGIPVDIDLVDNILGKMSGSVVAVGNKFTNPGFSDVAPPDGMKTTYTGKHGTASIVTVGGVSKIRYTPADMNMNTTDVIGYGVKYNETEGEAYYYSNVTVIPAANIYYEDSFLNFSNATGGTNANGNWVKESSQTSATQAQDRPGVNNALGDLDANNVYGFDKAYENCTTFSLDSAHKVTVNKDTGSNTNAPKATFTFSGTGFDVVSLTDSISGCLWVNVKDASGNQVRSIVVNNYYGYTYGLYNVTYTFDGAHWQMSVDSKAGSNATEKKANKPANAVVNQTVSGVEYVWVVDKNAADCLYQVPVIKVDGLTYGTYNVEMKVVYLASQDMQKKNSYTVWLDAIRVYNPAKNDAASNNAYEQDGESNPFFTTVKSLLVGPGDFKAGTDEVNGTVFVDGKASGVTIAEYDNQGPNNETYLEKNNGIAFKLRHTSTSSTAPVVNLQIGAKLAKGTSATMSFQQGLMGGEKSINLTTSTNMFYKIGAVNWTKVNGVWESDPILIWCSDAANGSILSLTDIKATGRDATNINVVAVAAASDDFTSSGAGMYVLYDTEVGDLIDDVLGFEEEQVDRKITLKYPTLSLEGEVKYNFYYTVENIDVAVEDMGLITWSAKPEDASIVGAEDVIPGAVYNADAGEYMVRTNGIPAKKLADNLYFRVYAKLADGTYVYSPLTYYSAKFYAYERLKNSESADTKALCVALMNYGTAAQIHFGYNTENLMNAELTAEQKALVNAYSADMIDALPAVDAAKAADFVSNGGFSTGYPSVSFEGAFAINYYFVPNKAIDGDLTLYCWDLETYNSVDKLTADNATAKIVMSQTITGEYFATYTGIAAKQIDDAVFVAGVYESEGVRYSTNVVAYSVGAYCADKVVNGSDTMKAFAAETVVFGHYAEIYFDNLQK